MAAPLWVVTSADAEVFLLGAMPGARDRGWLSDEIVATVGRCDEVWFEVPPSDDPASHPVLAEVGLSDVPLPERLGPVRWSRFEGAARSVGLDPAGLVMLAPWLGGQLIDRGLVAASGADPDAEVDHVIASLATEHGISLRSEFTAEEVLRWFGELPDDAELDYVDLMLDRVERGADGLAADCTAWADGEPETATSFERDNITAHPAISRPLALDRNRAWLPRIDDMLGRPGARFVVVGLLHLVGDASIVDSLRDKGYAVTLS